MTIRRYTAQDRARWDELVRYSLNGTFLCMRSYMEYHADRFHDHSLVYCNDKGSIVAILPANEGFCENGEKTLYSHQGLTFGGWIYGPHLHMSQLMEIGHLTLQYLKDEGFDSLIYKQTPSIFQKVPTEGDEYVLWRLGASLDHCLVSCAIKMGISDPNSCKPEIEPSRRRRYSKLRTEKRYRIRPGALSEFWPIMEENLKNRYGVSPVHSLEEMTLLQQRFPHQIICILAEREGIITAGAILYLSDNVVHLQYGHCTPLGREEGALDFLYQEILSDEKLFLHRQYFDFGTSNEQGGRYLNQSLIAQKEGFGGRTVTFRTYRIDLHTSDK